MWGPWREIPLAQRRSPVKSLHYYEENYQNSKRGMVEAYWTGDYAMKDIADYFNVHYSTVSRAIKRTERGNV